MFDLLDYQSQRVIKIINALTIDRQFITVDEIIKLNNCSERTAYNDINYIFEKWQDLLKPIKIDATLQLNHISVGNLKIVIRDILQENLNFTLLINLFKVPYQNVSYYASKNHISVSHTYRTISHINQALENYNMKIVSKDNLLYIEGKNETHLRIFFTLLLLDYYQLDDIFEYKVDYDQAFKLIEDFTRLNDFSDNEVLLSLRTVLLLVSLRREAQGFSLEVPNKHSHISDDEKKTLERLDKYHEKEYIAALYTVKEMVGLNKNNTIMKASIRIFVKLFLANNVLAIKDNEQEKLINSLANFINFFRSYPYNNAPIINRPAIYGKRFALRNQSVFKQIQKHIRYFKKDTQISLEQEIYELIFWVALDFPEVELIAKKQILIASDYGINHARQLEKLLSRHFPDSIFHTQSLLNYSFSPDDLVPYDLCISTINVDCVKNAMPMVLIHDFPDANDIKNIYNALYIEKTD